MRLRSRVVMGGAAALVSLAVMTAEAATRLTYFIGGAPTPIAWPLSSFPLEYQIDRSAASRLPGGEGLIREAFQGWESVPDSAVRFRSGGVVDAKPGKDGRNLVSINDSLFEDSGFVAFTTTWFDETTGLIQEADIQIDAQSASQGVALRSLIQHEVGHLLGLDHAASLSSMMFPWVGEDELPGLDTDDQIALASMYPAAGYKARTGTIEGTVRSANGGVFGAQVVALAESGAMVASTLTDRDGRYVLSGLPQGSYRLYAEPLDGPVETTNLSGVWRQGAANFSTTFLPASQRIAVGAGANGSADIQVDATAPRINPRWIGAFPADSAEIKLSTTALQIRAGDRIAIAVGGDGVVNGKTTFEVLNPGFARVSEFRYSPNTVWATFDVAASAQPASVVVMMQEGGASAALTGALRIEASAAPPPSSRGRLVRR